MVHGCCVFSLLSTQEDFQGRISAASGGYVFLLFVYSRSHSLDLAGAKGVDFVSGGSTEESCLISRKQSFRFIGISPQLQKKKQMEMYLVTRFSNCVWNYCLGLHASVHSIHPLDKWDGYLLDRRMSNGL